MIENWLSNNGILGCRFLGTRSFFKRLRRYSLVSIIVLTVYTPAGAGDVFKDVPGNIDPNAKYLFYMHGFAVEQGGPRAKAYDYSGILKELAKRGFVVIGEERQNSITAKLKPVISKYGLDSLQALADTLKNKDSVDIRNSVLQAITTHEDAWFHPPELFNLLDDYLFSNMLDSGHKRYRIWVIGCGAGQLPYSLAMKIRGGEPAFV